MTTKTTIAVGALVLLALTTFGNAAVGADDPRQGTARAFFAEGKYAESIAIYAQLFAEKNHPNYLFNIGRCYQNMGQPDRAITSFREYLRQGQNIPPKERGRAEAFIKEMEDLIRQREQAQTALVGVAAETPGPSAPGVASGASGGTPVPGTKPAVSGSGPAPTNPPAGGGAAAVPKAGTGGGHFDEGLAAFLKKQRDEATWKANAKPADEAKIAQIEKMLRGAPAGDPRRADYQLYLGTLYSGKHFDLKVRSRSAQNKAVASGGEADTATDRQARDLGAEANHAFLKAVENYVAASRVRGFAKTDEVLYRLGVLLQANNMSERAEDVLKKLLRGFPDSKWRKQIVSEGP